MNNSRRVRDFLTGAVTTALLVGTVGSAVAFSGSKTIDVIYRDIKLVVDGVAVTPKDANGKEVEPFVFEGTTYLPVRAVGEAVGKTVEWDGENNTVYLGTKPGESASLIQVCPPYQTRYVDVYTGDPKKSFEVVGTKYSEGLSCPKYNGGSYALFNLNGAYETLSFTAGPADGKSTGEKYTGTVMIYLDDKVVEEFQVEGGSMPTEHTINVKGALQMKIEMTGNEYGISFYHMEIH